MKKVRHEEVRQNLNRTTDSNLFSALIKKYFELNGKISHHYFRKFKSLMDN